MLPSGVSRLISVMALRLFRWWWSGLPNQQSVDVSGLAECRSQPGDFVVLQQHRIGAEVLGKVSATTGARDEQHVVGDRQQPPKSDLDRCRGMAGGDAGDDRIGTDHIAPAQWSERNERDPPGNALVENATRRPICQVVPVLYAHNVGDLERPHQMLMGDIADTDSGDQSVIPRRYQGSDLVDKPLVYRGVVQRRKLTAVSRWAPSVLRLSSIPARS